MVCGVFVNLFNAPFLCDYIFPHVKAVIAASLNVSFFMNISHVIKIVLNHWKIPWVKLTDDSWVFGVEIEEKKFWYKNYISISELARSVNIVDDNHLKIIQPT